MVPMHNTVLRMHSLCSNVEIPWFRLCEKRTVLENRSWHLSACCHRTFSAICKYSSVSDAGTNCWPVGWLHSSTPSVLSWLCWWSFHCMKVVYRPLSTAEWQESLTLQACTQAWTNGRIQQYTATYIDANFDEYTAANPMSWRLVKVVAAVEKTFAAARKRWSQLRYVRWLMPGSSFELKTPSTVTSW